MRVYVVGLVLACLLVGCVDGKWDTISLLTSGQKVRISEGFGASAGATLNVSIHAVPSYDTQDNESDLEGDIWYYFIIYTESQHKNVMYYRSSDACIQPSYFRMEFRGAFTREFTLHEEDYYYVYIMNCQRTPVEISGSMLWLQANGGQLSYEEIPLMWSNLALFICCWLSAIVWFCCLLFRRSFVVHLHVLLFVFITLEVFYYAVLSRIVIVASTGPTETNSLLELYIPIFLSVGAETLFITCLLLISGGWSILTPHLGLRSKQLLLIAILLYGGFYLAYSSCSNTQNLRDVYELFFYVIKFLVLFSGIVTMNGAGEYLRSEFSIQHPQRVYIARKVAMFYNLKWILLFLLSVPIVMVFLDFTILSWQEKWLTPTVNGWVLLISCWGEHVVAFLIRPRKAGQNYYFLVHHSPQEPRAPEEESDSEDEESSEDSSHSEPEGAPEDIEMQVFSSSAD